MFGGGRATQKQPPHQKTNEKEKDRQEVQKRSG
jgi:hypothetical protein